MRQLPSGAFRRLLLTEWEERLIRGGTPGKTVDPEDPQDVIDPEEVEHIAHLANALTPPRIVFTAMHVPAVERDAPVLAPLLRECVHLQDPLRRTATRPLQVKQVRSRPRIC